MKVEVTHGNIGPKYHSKAWKKQSLNGKIIEGGRVGIWNNFFCKECMQHMTTLLAIGHKNNKLWAFKIPS
jgi:hypothetical protein